MLKGQAKKDYQKEYMRKKRSNKNPLDPPLNVRPVLDPSVRPYSKEEQLDIRMSKANVKKRALFKELHIKFDHRNLT